MERLHVRTRALRLLKVIPIAVAALAASPLALLGSTAYADGITWASRTPAAVNAWRSVTWGGPAGQQKFVAVALASGAHPPILNAVDSDWWNHRAALADAGVTCEFLCRQHQPER